MTVTKASLCTLAVSLCTLAATAQPPDERISTLEEKFQTLTARQQYMPHIHGILRGKCEYQPSMSKGRFEVRNARLSAEGKLPLRSSYKLEVDLCDESSIKMKDAWVRVNPWKSLRLTLGQHRMPFSIDAHRNPSAQFFANRSFIAKQVGNMRDVGAGVGFDVASTDGRTVLAADAGVFNGSSIDGQKAAWFSQPAYSARVQYFPVARLAIVPSLQHQFIAGREASYTSVDVGAYFEHKGFHLEAEFLRKMYAHSAFSHCNAVNAMAFYRQPVAPRTGQAATGDAKGKRWQSPFIHSISYLLRYDYMGNHSNGSLGFDPVTNNLVQTDDERHRLTAGLTLSVSNPYFPTDIRINYEKYFYPHASSPKESEQDKVVVELMVKF